MPAQPKRAQKKLASPTIAGHPTRSAAAAREYLRRERASRGDEIADTAVTVACRILEYLDSAATSPKERAKARRALASFRIRMARVAPSVAVDVAPNLDDLARRLASRVGKPLEAPARFARAMLTWAALELGSDGEAQLTATELMAAATIAGPDFQPETTERGRWLDFWVKLHARQLPKNPARLAHEGRCLKDNFRPMVLTPDGRAVPIGPRQKIAVDDVPRFFDRT